MFLIAFERRELIVAQIMQEQGVTEQLKSENAILWVRKANNIRACVDEIIRDELIHDCHSDVSAMMGAIIPLELLVLLCHCPL